MTEDTYFLISRSPHTDNQYNKEERKLTLEQFSSDARHHNKMKYGGTCLTGIQLLYAVEIKHSLLATISNSNIKLDGRKNIDGSFSFIQVVWQDRFK